MTKDDEIAKLIPNIANELRDAPEKTLACMGLAIHQVLTKDLERHAAELQAQEGLSRDGETMVNVPHIHASVLCLHVEGSHLRLSLALLSQ